MKRRFAVLIFLVVVIIGSCKTKKANTKTNYTPEEQSVLEIAHDLCECLKLKDADKGDEAEQCMKDVVTKAKEDPYLKEDSEKKEYYRELLEAELANCDTPSAAAFLKKENQTEPPTKMEELDKKE